MFRYKQKNSGFTLIELLVVVAIIGMLLSVIMVSFGRARIRSRDAKRLSDMQQMRSGLDLHLNVGNGYPDPATWNAGGYLNCGTTAIMEIPTDQTLGVPYVYVTQNATIGCGGTVYKNYYVQLTTEGDSDIGPAGTYYLSPAGLTAAPPF